MQDPVRGHNILEDQGDVVDSQTAVLVLCDDDSLVQEVGGPEAEPGGQEAGAEAARQDVAAEDVGAAGAGAEEAFPCRLVQFLKRGRQVFLDKNAAEITWGNF
jgi:hypothetical protein